MLSHARFWRDVRETLDDPLDDSGEQPGRSWRRRARVLSEFAISRAPAGAGAVDRPEALPDGGGVRRRAAAAGVRDSELTA
jgi:hypothetical protein